MIPRFSKVVEPGKKRACPKWNTPSTRIAQRTGEGKMLPAKVILPPARRCQEFDMKSIAHSPGQDASAGNPNRTSHLSPEHGSSRIRSIHSGRSEEHTSELQSHSF